MLHEQQNDGPIKCLTSARAQGAQLLVQPVCSTAGARTGLDSCSTEGIAHLQCRAERPLCWSCPGGRVRSGATGQRGCSTGRTWRTTPCPAQLSPVLQQKFDIAQNTLPQATDCEEALMVSHVCASHSWHQECARRRMYKKRAADCTSC